MEKTQDKEEGGRFDAEPQVHRLTNAALLAVLFPCCALLLQYLMLQNLSSDQTLRQGLAFLFCACIYVTLSAPALGCGGDGLKLPAFSTLSFALAGVSTFYFISGFEIGFSFVVQLKLLAVGFSFFFLLYFMSFFLRSFALPAVFCQIFTSAGGLLLIGCFLFGDNLLQSLETTESKKMLLQWMTTWNPVSASAITILDTKNFFHTPLVYNLSSANSYPMVAPKLQTILYLHFGGAGIFALSGHCLRVLRRRWNDLSLPLLNPFAGKSAVRES